MVDLLHVVLVKVIVFFWSVVALFLLYRIHKFIQALNLQVAALSLSFGTESLYEGLDLEKTFTFRQCLIECLFYQTQRQLLLPQLHLKA